VNPEDNTTKPYGILRIIALIAVFGGAVGSLALMSYTGRHNPSILLILLFAGWVLSPFIGVLTADVLSKTWSDRARLALYCWMLVGSLGSVVCYTGVLNPPGAKPAAVFLIVPLISWLLIGIFILITRLGKKNSRPPSPQ
jgi:hypothetical protein